MSAINPTRKRGDGMADQKRAWLYSRVAHDDGMVLAAQKNFLRCWAAGNGYSIVGETAEEGSGRCTDRPGLSGVMQAVREKRTDVVIVKNLGRLTRHCADMPQHVKTLQANGVTLVSIDDGLSLDLATICPWA